MLTPPYGCRPGVITTISRQCELQPASEKDWKTMFNDHMNHGDIPLFAKVRFCEDDEEEVALFPSTFLCGPPGPMIYSSPGHEAMLLLELRDLTGAGSFPQVPCQSFSKNICTRSTSCLTCRAFGETIISLDARATPAHRFDGLPSFQREHFGLFCLADLHSALEHCLGL